MIKTFAIALLLAVAGLISFGLIMARREQSHRRPMPPVVRRPRRS
jgi:hypothetical protein